MSDLSCVKCNKNMAVVKHWFQCSGCQSYFCPSCKDSFCMLCKNPVKDAVKPL